MVYIIYNLNNIISIIILMDFSLLLVINIITCYFFSGLWSRRELQQRWGHPEAGASSARAAPATSRAHPGSVRGPATEGGRQRGSGGGVPLRERHVGRRRSVDSGRLVCLWSAGQDKQRL